VLAWGIFVVSVISDQSSLSTRREAAYNVQSYTQLIQLNFQGASESDTQSREYCPHGGHDVGPRAL
jgi:hypothetical protein